MDKVNTGGVTFRWNGEQLLVTTPTSQYALDPAQTMDLMVHLYDSRESMVEALHRLPGWARPERPTTNGAEEEPKRLSSPTAGPFVVTRDDDVT